MTIFPKHRVMLYLDSLWSPATHVFQWLFGYVETLSEIWNEAFDVEKWLFINLQSTLKQDDDCNCGVFSCINAYLACSTEPIEYSVNDTEDFDRGQEGKESQIYGTPETNK